jgi:hypothetical protein
MCVPSHLAELLNCGRASPASSRSEGGALKALPLPWPPTTVLGRASCGGCARGELRGVLHAASAVPPPPVPGRPGRVPGRGPVGGCGGVSAAVGSVDEGGSG